VLLRGYKGGGFKAFGPITSFSGLLGSVFEVRCAVVRNLFGSMMSLCHPSFATVGISIGGNAMRYLILAASAALTVAVTGCAPTPISADQADPVPSSRLYAFGAKSESQIVVTRDSGFVGSGCKIRFYIDGKSAADFYSGEVARFGVSAGKHLLAAEPIEICGGSGIGESEITLKAGESARRRVAGASVMPTSF
jgi:hypothetical protein